MKRTIRTPRDFVALQQDLKALSMPFTIAVRDGADRSNEQNALAFKWYKEAADWLGDQEAWQVRAECKLNIGVRMLVAEDDDFREKWFFVFAALTYEQKLALMVEPHDYPVTRLMNKDQMSRYMDAVCKKYTEAGVVLTHPDDRGREVR